MKTTPPIVAVLLLSLTSVASAQLSNWVQSPSRPDVWYALEPLSSHNWVSGRARIEETYVGLEFEFASITDQAESDLVRVLAGNSTQDGVYIGISDFAREGQWVWLDGSSTAYSEWIGGGPSNDPAQGGTYRDYGLLLEGGWLATNANGSGPQDAMCMLHSGDCDNNQVPDVWELWNGTAIDVNDNGIIDVCESIGTSYCSSTIHSGGLAARIAAGGSAVVAENNVFLHVWDLPTTSPGYFLMSQQPDFVPMFSGTPGNLCVGPPIVRLGFLPGGVLNSGPNGTGVLSIDLSIANVGSPIAAGETWHFQYWTRDIFSSNTTDGVMVAFQ